ncbi:hypothetical protein ACTM6V_23785 [Citrobacter freundii]
MQTKSEQAGLALSVPSRPFLCLAFCCCRLPNSPLSRTEKTISEHASLPAGLRASPVIINTMLCPPPGDFCRKTFASQRLGDVLFDEFFR